MFYKKICEQIGPKSAWLEHLKAQILNAPFKRDSFYNTCCIFSGQIVLQPSQVCSFINFLFENMNFEKIIHAEQFLLCKVK